MTHGFLLNGKNEMLQRFIFSRSHSFKHLYLAKNNSEAVTFQSLGALNHVSEILMNVCVAGALQAELTPGRTQPFRRRIEELCVEVHVFHHYCVDQLRLHNKCPPSQCLKATICLMTLGVDWVLLLVLPKLTSTAAESSKWLYSNVPIPSGDARMVRKAGFTLHVVSQPRIPQKG